MKKKINYDEKKIEKENFVEKIWNGLLPKLYCKRVSVS